MVNIYDTANQLANDLRETQQFLALKEAMDAVKADEGSRPCSRNWTRLKWKSWKPSKPARN